MVVKFKNYTEKILTKDTKQLRFLVDPTSNRIVRVGEYSPVAIFLGEDYTNIKKQLIKKGWKIKL